MNINPSLGRGMNPRPYDAHSAYTGEQIIRQQHQAPPRDILSKILTTVADHIDDIKHDYAKIGAEDQFADTSYYVRNKAKQIEHQKIKERQLQQAHKDLAEWNKSITSNPRPQSNIMVNKPVYNTPNDYEQLELPLFNDEQLNCNNMNKLSTKFDKIYEVNEKILSILQDILKVLKKNDIKEVYSNIDDIDDIEDIDIEVPDTIKVNENGEAFYLDENGEVQYLELEHGTGNELLTEEWSPSNNIENSNEQ